MGVKFIFVVLLEINNKLKLEGLIVFLFVLFLLYEIRIVIDKRNKIIFEIFIVFNFMI